MEQIIKASQSGEIPSEKLVRPGEEQILFVAKQHARYLYPHA